MNNFLKYPSNIKHLVNVQKLHFVELFWIASEWAQSSQPHLTFYWIWKWKHFTLQMQKLWTTAESSELHKDFTQVDTQNTLIDSHVCRNKTYTKTNQNLLQWWICWYCRWTLRSSEWEEVNWLIEWKLKKFHFNSFFFSSSVLPIYALCSLNSQYGSVILLRELFELDRKVNSYQKKKRVVEVNEWRMWKPEHVMAYENRWCVKWWILCCSWKKKLPPSPLSSALLCSIKDAI